MTVILLLLGAVVFVLLAAGMYCALGWLWDLRRLFMGEVRP